MTKVSVITPTYRVGGLDVALHSLKNQTMKSLEWVLVDELYGERRGLVERLSAETGVEIVHVPPMSIGRPSFSTMWNTAFVHARGELVYTMDDYTWLPPDTLQRHWDAYERSGGAATLTGPVDEVEFPEAKWPPPLMEGKRFLHGEPDYYSVFKEPAGEIFPSKMKILRRDGRWGAWEEDAGGFLPQGTLKVYVNASLPLDIAVALNGFDVGYDGGDGYRDQDLFARAEIYGHKFLFDPECSIYHMEHGGAFPRVFKSWTWRDHPEGLDPLDVNASYFRNRLKAIFASGGALLPAPNPYWINDLRKEKVSPRPPKFRFAPPRAEVRAEYRETNELKAAVAAGRAHPDALAEFMLSRGREAAVYGGDVGPAAERYFRGEAGDLGEISDAVRELAARPPAKVLTPADRTVAMWLRARVNYDSVLHNFPGDVFGYNLNARRIVQGMDYPDGSAKWVALLEPLAEHVGGAKQVASEGVLAVSKSPVREVLRSANFADYEFAHVNGWWCGVGRHRAPAIGL